MHAATAMDTPVAPLERPAWAQRTFCFGQPPWMAIDFAERLRGTVHRLAALLADLDTAALRARTGGAWSVLQNAGHLGDVEELWQQRVEDLRAGRDAFTPADAGHFRALAEAHQTRSVEDVLTYLTARRAPFVRALLTADERLRSADAHHERLGTRLRLVDMAQFAAEHDDHHLLRIRALRRELGAPEPA